MNENNRIIMYREALNEALKEEMRADSSVFVVGEGIADRGGSFKVTVGLLKEFGPDRVLDTSLSEASFTGAGVGAAIVGMRPVVEILFIDFAMLILDQIINQAAKYSFMTGWKGKVPMVLRTQGGVGNGVAAQHSQSLEALFYHIPGLKVAMPSTAYDAKGLLKAAIRDDDPVIFIEHKLLYMNKGFVPEKEYLLEPGKGSIKKEGMDLTLIAWSGMVPPAMNVAEKLGKEGISIEVVDPMWLVPLDKELLLNSARKTGHVVIAQEAIRRGGVASDISSIIMEEVFDYLDAPVRIVAGKNTPIPFNEKLEKFCIPNEGGIEQAIRECLYDKL